MKSALLKLIKGSGNGHLLAELAPPRTSLWIQMHFYMELCVKLWHICLDLSKIALFYFWTLNHLVQAALELYIDPSPSVFQVLGLQIGTTMFDSKYKLFFKMFKLQLFIYYIHVLKSEQWSACEGWGTTAAIVLPSTMWVPRIKLCHLTWWLFPHTPSQLPSTKSFDSNRKIVVSFSDLMNLFTKRTMQRYRLKWHFIYSYLL